MSNTVNTFVMPRAGGVILRQQRGAALVIALIMLVMVSLLAAGGFLLSTTEARGASGWSDRQRALFTAEGVLIQGENAAKTLIGTIDSTSQTAVEAVVRSAGTGYYVRTDGEVPDLDPWPTSDSIKATVPSGSKVSNVYYMIVYEGMGTVSGTGLVSGNGNTSQTSSKPRFTIYAEAGGIKEATYVVLSSSKVLN